MNNAQYMKVFKLAADRIRNFQDPDNCYLCSAAIFLKLSGKISEWELRSFRARINAEITPCLTLGEYLFKKCDILIIQEEGRQLDCRLAIYKEIIDYYDNFGDVLPFHLAAKYCEASGDFE